MFTKAVECLLTFLFCVSLTKKRKNLTKNLLTEIKKNCQILSKVAQKIKKLPKTVLLTVTNSYFILLRISEARMLYFCE